MPSSRLWTQRSGHTDRSESATRSLPPLRSICKFGFPSCARRCQYAPRLASTVCGNDRVVPVEPWLPRPGGGQPLHPIYRVRSAVGTTLMILSRPMSSVADLVVARLREAGVRCVFGMPGGGSNLDLVAACARAALPFVLTATETGAAIAALAQAEITGRPGACLTTQGPGVTSVVNGVACARLERAPIL